MRLQMRTLRVDFKTSIDIASMHLPLPWRRRRLLTLRPLLIPRTRFQFNLNHFLIVVVVVIDINITTNIVIVNASVVCIAADTRTAASGAIDVILCCRRGYGGRETTRLFVQWQ